MVAVEKPCATGSIEKQPSVPGSGLGTRPLGWYGCCAHSTVLSRDTGKLQGWLQDTAQAVGTELPGEPSSVVAQLWGMH